MCCEEIRNIVPCKGNSKPSNHLWLFEGLPNACKDVDFLRGSGVSWLRSWLASCGGKEPALADLSRPCKESLQTKTQSGQFGACLGAYFERHSSSHLLFDTSSDTSLWQALMRSLNAYYAAKFFEVSHANHNDLFASSVSDSNARTRSWCSFPLFIFVMVVSSPLAWVSWQHTPDLDLLLLCFIMSYFVSSRTSHL